MSKLWHPRLETARVYAAMNTKIQMTCEQHIFPHKGITVGVPSRHKGTHSRIRQPPTHIGVKRSKHRADTAAHTLWQASCTPHDREKQVSLPSTTLLERRHSKDPTCTNNTCNLGQMEHPYPSKCVPLSQCSALTPPDIRRPLWGHRACEVFGY